MNERERFRETVLFGQPDKVPLWPGEPGESTLRMWHQQGLPKGVDYHQYLLETLGISDAPVTTRVDLSSYFDRRSFFHMLPPFESKILEHRDGHYIVQDWSGMIVEISDEYDPSYLEQFKDFVTRKYIKFPVESRKDWDNNIRWRYDALHPERIPDDFGAKCRALQDRDYVLEVVIRGPFWLLRDWCGFEDMCVLLITEPDFVQEMIDHYSRFVLQSLDLILRHTPLDLVWISEDMAYKNHSMISPRMVRQFFLPIWKQWADHLKAGGCPVICLDSDGCINELLPLWIEAGFNATYPVEVAAGNDIVALREQYGQQMAFLGGLDKRALAAGGDVLRNEVMRVVPPLLNTGGGLIPKCDHGVPPDISWSNYVEYSRLLAELLGWL